MRLRVREGHIYKIPSFAQHSGKSFGGAREVVIFEFASSLSMLSALKIETESKMTAEVPAPVQDTFSQWGRSSPSASLHCALESSMRLWKVSSVFLTMHVCTVHRTTAYSPDLKETSRFVIFSVGKHLQIAVIY